MFIGNEKAGQHSAILYTLVENCRRLGLDPDMCLREVLTRLPSATNWTLHQLTPRAKAQRLPDKLAQIA